ncbi:M14 family zinc carboxypeptidase [Saccharomonospora sp. NPDC006951]
MLPEWLVKEIDEVPGFRAFAGVDELHQQLSTLASEYPEVAVLRRVGTSRDGEPLLCLSITGPATTPARPEALVFGLPHPNEPIGGLTAIHLARRLCVDPSLRERLRHTWHIIACIDPDGLRLNEGWLRGPFTREHYARHFYRPAGVDQVEWTFPLDYKDAYFDEALPETQALMRLIDQHRPSLVCSLHNGELGGVYYYLSRREPPLHEILQEVPGYLGLPLDRGEPEAPYMVRLADGIFLSSSMRRAYDYRIGLGESWAGDSGDNTASYAARYGSLTLVSELPYWTSPVAGDDTPTGTSYASALAEQSVLLEDLSELLNQTMGKVEGQLSAAQSPYWRATRFFAAFLASATSTARQRSLLPESERKATVAELASLTSDVQSYRLRYGGILLRALNGELAVGNTRAPIRAARATVAARYEGWLAEDAGDEDYEVIPIRLLVATQYAATIAAAEHLVSSGTSSD